MKIKRYIITETHPVPGVPGTTSTKQLQHPGGGFLFTEEEADNCLEANSDRNLTISCVTIPLTSEERYAAYREEEHEFKEEDIRNAICAVTGYSPDDDPETRRENCLYFKKVYGLDLKKLLTSNAKKYAALRAEMLAYYEHCWDANLDENTMLETAVKHILRGITGTNVA